MRRLHLFLAHLLQFLALVLTFLLLLLAHPGTLPLIVSRLPLPPQLSYRHIEGSLLYGITVTQPRYGKLFHAKRLTLRYNLFKLLSPVPRLALLELDAPVVDLTALPASSGDGNSSLNLPFTPVLERLIIRHADIRTQTRRFLGNLEADGLTWHGDDDIEVASLQAGIILKEGYLKAKGDYRKKHLRLHGRFRLSHALTQTLAKTLKTTPRQWGWRLAWHQNELTFSLTQPTPLRLAEDNLSIRIQKLKGVYHLTQNYADVTTRWQVTGPKGSTAIDQNLTITPDLAFATQAKMHLLAPLSLPFQTAWLELAGNKESLVGNISAGPLNLKIYGLNYNRFTLTADANLTPNLYGPYLPALASENTLALHADALIHTKPAPAVTADISLKGRATNLQLNTRYNDNRLLLIGQLNPRQPIGGFWQKLPAPFRHTAHLFVYLTPEQKNLNLIQKENLVTLFEQRKNLTGWANVGSLKLSLSGTANAGNLTLKAQTHILSIAELLRQTGLGDTPFDAELFATVNLKKEKTLRLGFDIRLPWYTLRGDAQTMHYGLQSRLNGYLKGHTLTLSRYDVAFDERRFIQRRPSRILLPDANTTAVRFAPFRFLDNGKVEGYFDTATQEANLRILGQNVHYRGAEGNLTFQPNIHLIKTAKKVDIEGTLNLLDGTVTYLPPRSNVATDSDIVIIQQIKEPSHTPSLYNIHITAQKPLRYLLRQPTLQADIAFIPDLTLWKESGKPLEILGMLTLPKGTIKAEDKAFTLRPSHLYFGGGWPINPYLDIHLFYPYEAMKFYVYVSHTLHDPVILFSSEPPMSQNDIMSYILFGSPADDAFKKNSNSTMGTMLLGLGIKKALGSTLGINLDTLNIIDNKNGGLGIEVGTRVAKNLKILYRNDSISSVILQYTLSPALRFDIDVKETGEEGINILYIKDFRGPKRLNYPPGVTPPEGAQTLRIFR